MLVSIFLNVEGMEQQAKGLKVHTWHFSEQIREEGDVRYDEQGMNFIWLKDVEFTLPSPAQCIRPVLEKLKAREAEIRSEAEKELMIITQRRNDLLMIGHEVRDV